MDRRGTVILSINRISIRSRNSSTVSAGGSSKFSSGAEAASVMGGSLVTFVGLRGVDGMSENLGRKIAADGEGPPIEAARVGRMTPATFCGGSSECLGWEDADTFGSGNGSRVGYGKARVTAGDGAFGGDEATGASCGVARDRLTAELEVSIDGCWSMAVSRIMAFEGARDMEGRGRKTD